ncbi:hypothetical protein [Gryllotalpicola sp.]|uniref:hypothetical protein n=1 Tax=Gryllotalpicola sp. TaxID=1932787 RepID=UPI00262848E4|nr:hypothetical protein [Gryllotalpicola sp.]
MFQDADWSERDEHMQDRHGVTPAPAEEALADERRIVFDPDYASLSGQSTRIVGHSRNAGCVLTVIIVTDDDGKEWGASAWPANSKDLAYYNRKDTKQ